jgi:hypothetical protein
MQATVNNIEKLKVQSREIESEIEALKSLENKIQKTKNMSDVIFMIIKNIQENEHIRQKENKIFIKLENEEDQTMRIMEIKNEILFIKDLVKRLELEVCDMMYNFLNYKNKVTGNLTYIKFLLEILKDKNKISETNFQVLEKGIKFLLTAYENYFDYFNKRQNEYVSENSKEIFIKDITENLEASETKVKNLKDTERPEIDNIKDTKNNSGKVSIEKESLEAEKKDTGEMIETIEIKKTDYFFNDFKRQKSAEKTTKRDKAAEDKKY